jgi:hypothetical protein
MKPDQAMPFPTDNRLRDDIGLPPLAESRPPLMLMPRTPAYFPTDDRLREDIGLPPIGEGCDVDGARRSSSASMTRRLALSCAALVRVRRSRLLDGCVAAVAAIRHPRRPTGIIRQSAPRHI